MKEIYLGNELGNLTQQECQRIKKAMDGKTYASFKVHWSNMYGNCQLIVDSGVEDEEDAKKLFFANLAHELSEHVKNVQILEEYIKIKMQYDNGIAIFEGEHRNFFFFKDAVWAKENLNLPAYRMPASTTSEGSYVVSIEKSDIVEAVQKCAVQGKGLYYVKMI